MEQDSEAEAVLDAALQHLRDTMYLYGVGLDERAHAMTKKNLAQLGCISRAEVVRFYQDPPSWFEDVVRATCPAYYDRVMLDLRNRAATSVPLQEPTRYRREGSVALANRIEAQRSTQESVDAMRLRGPPPATKLRALLKGTAIEGIAEHGQSLENGMVTIDSEHVCDFEAVWKELHRMYPGELTTETANALLQIVLPHLFRAGTRTIKQLAGMEEVFYEMLEDIEQSAIVKEMEISRPTETAMRSRLDV